MKFGNLSIVNLKESIGMVINMSEVLKTLVHSVKRIEELEVENKILKEQNLEILETLKKINENIKAIVYNTHGLSDCINPQNHYARAHITTRNES